MFFEAMDLYRTLDLKFNPMDSSYFESNFKRTIHYPTTRANMNEPGKRMTSLQWRFWNEKSGGHCGAKEKRKGANINVSLAW